MTSKLTQILQPTGIIFRASPRPAYWRPWFLLVLPPISLTAISMIVGVIGVINDEGDRSVINSTINEWIPVILMINHGLLFAILLWFLKLDGLKLSDIGWTKSFGDWKGLLEEIVIGVLAGVVLYILHQYVWQSAVDWLAGGRPTLRTASDSAPIGNNIFISVLVGIVLGGFVEEQVYRGYILTRLTEKLSMVPAVLFMIFFFMLLHIGLGWTGMLVAGMTGLMLTLLFIWRRSVYAAIIAHALINTFVLLL